ncbi:MAG TPA: ABC transporter permease [Blastocatellia bacterium]|nr:ABC transporter permease [Blastocatellia bacterium]
MKNRLRQTFAFVFVEYHLTRRYASWVVVFTFYSVVSSATISLIGVASKDYQLTMTLVIGALMWTFLSVLFNELAMSIAFERWEGTLEYTFMAPVSRFLHLLGVSIYATVYSLFRTAVVLVGLLLFVHLPVAGANFLGLLLVLSVSCLAFLGLGLMGAALPVMSPERGAEATNIFQGMLLLVSGIYYPVSVLPRWLQPLAALSPATYALSASRKLMGISGTGTHIGVAAPISSVTHELAILTVMGAVMIPLGLVVFSRVEHWAKRNGKLKRAG